jgi:hypothetical protein
MEVSMSRSTLVSVLALPLLCSAACASDDPAPSYTVHVRGSLAQSADLAAARGGHDGGARAVEEQARAAGDFAHHVLLGTAYAGTPTNELLAIDQWRGALGGVQGFYADPQFQAATGALFTAPPAVRVYERREDWHGWGEAGGHAGPYWYVIVEGRLAQGGAEANREAHDAVAGGFEAQASAAGDVAHLPHLAVDDPRAFFNIDVWASEQGMLQAFTEPAFQAAFLALFEGPPTVRIYRSTDWHQWYAP